MVYRISLAGPSTVGHLPTPPLDPIRIRAAKGDQIGEGVLRFFKKAGDAKAHQKRYHINQIVPYYWALYGLYLYIYKYHIEHMCTTYIRYSGILLYITCRSKLESAVTQ